MIRPRKLHKWIGIGIGLFFFMWTVTGVIMIFPGRRGPASAQSLPPDWSTAVVSPARAVAAAREAADSLGNPVRSVALAYEGGRLLYRVQLARGNRLIDATTGARYEVTREEAIRLARAAFTGTPGSVTVEPLARHDIRYPAGALPVFRVVLGDAAGTVAYVSPRDASVTLSDGTRRFRSMASRMHDFSLVRNLTGSSGLHFWLVMLSCIVAVAGVITGYWLAWPRRQRGLRTEG